MKLAKKTVMLLLAFALIAPVIGCGVGTTPADNKLKLARVVDYDGRMLVDDIALLLQTNRPLRTSRWIID